MSIYILLVELYYIRALDQIISDTFVATVLSNGPINHIYSTMKPKASLLGTVSNYQHILQVNKTLNMGGRVFGLVDLKWLKNQMLILKFSPVHRYKDFYLILNVKFEAHENHFQCLD